MAVVDYSDYTTGVIRIGEDDRQIYSIKGGSGDDTLGGNKGSDTIEGGKGNDSLKGGAGADTFVYNKGDGNDVIADYEEDDKIIFNSDTVNKVTAKNGDYIITLASKGNITIQGGADKVISYSDETGEHTYPETVKFNAKGTAATLTSSYMKDGFDTATYEDGDAIKTIDASAVEHDLTITANKLANKIIGTEEDDYIDGGAGKDTILGGDGNDTILGGKGNDNLTGGDGKNVFVYNNGDGNDVITDYKQGDVIQIASGTINTTAQLKGNDYVFTVGKGTITVKDSKNKYIHVVDAYGNDFWWPDYPGEDGWTYSNAKVTLNKKYRDDTFDVSVFDDFAGVAKTIDGSAVTHDMTIIANKQANRIIGTDENDYIDGAAGKDTILGGDGNDTLVGGKGNDSLTGGAGADVFVYNKGDGNDIIVDYEEDDQIVFNSDTVNKIAASNGNYIITLASKAKITIKGGADKVISYSDETGDHTYPETVKFNANGTAATLTSSYMKDSFDTATYEDGDAIKTIDASAVEHNLTITGNKLANAITGTEGDDYIDGGAGADKINGGDGNDTIVGGKGNDSLTGGDGADVFVWNKGDGNDKILDYENEDAIQFNSDTVKKVSKSGNNLIFTLASNAKLTVVGGAEDGKVISYSDEKGEYTYPEIVKFNANGTAATLTSSYVKDGFDTATYEDGDAIKAIDASAVEHNLTITGNKLANTIIGTGDDDYIDGGAGADKINGGDGNDTIVGGKGNDNLTGGDGADVFVWNKGDGNDKILDYENEDAIQFNSDTVNKVAKSGSNVIFTLASKAKLTVVGGAESGKVISYSDANGEYTYPEVVDTVEFSQNGKGVTIKAEYTEDSFDIADYADYKDTVITINASAANQDLEITANKKNNIITGGDGNDTINGGAGNDKINGGKAADVLYGGAGADTLEGGAGNDTLTGGAGADVFVWSKGGGNDTIVDFTNEDSLEIKSDTVKKFTTSKNGKDVVLNLTSGKKITFKDAADKFISYTDANGPGIYPDTPVIYNEDHTGATLSANYTDSQFTPDEYSDYATTIETIDASAVTNDIEITGNAKANRITGSDQNDTLNGGAGNDILWGGKGDDSLWGGKGTDTLYGGDGADTFIYNSGDGKTVIADFAEIDIIMVQTGKVGSYSARGNDVTFETDNGSGSIVVQGGADKHIEIVDSSGNLLKHYSP